MVVKLPMGYEKNMNLLLKLKLPMGYEKNMNLFLKPKSKKKEKNFEKLSEKSDQGP